MSLSFVNRTSKNGPFFITLTKEREKKNTDWNGSIRIYFDCFKSPVMKQRKKEKDMKSMIKSKVIKYD
jgi:hypothetical protein